MLARLLNLELPLPSRQLPQVGVTFVVSLCLIFAAAFLLAPVLYNSAYVADLYPLLDGVHRVQQGQVPHKDFLSPIGPLNYYAPAWLEQLGLTTKIASIRAFSVICALMALPILVYLRKTRLNGRSFLLASALVLLSLLAQMNLGDGFSDATIAMYYNKIGFCFVALVFIFCFKPFNKIDIIVTSLIIIFLFYIKFTYCVAALSILIYSSIYFKNYKFMLPIGAATLPIFMQQFYNGLPLYYLQDILGTIKSTEGLDTTLIWNLFADATLANICCLLLPLYFLEKRTLHDVMLALYTLAFGLVLTASNAQWANLFLPLVFIIYALNKPHRPALNFLSTLYFVIALLPAVQNIWMTLKHSYKRDVQATVLFDYKIGKLVTPTLGDEDKAIMQRALEADFPSEKLLGTSSTEITHFSQGFLFDKWYVQTLPEGVALANQYCQGERIFTLDYGNAMPLLTGNPSVGKVMFIYPTRTMSATNPPSFSEVFQNTTCIFEPRLPHSLFALVYLRKNYGAEMAQKFRQVAQGKAWKVYKLKV